MCKCRIISFGKGLPRNYICSRDFHFKDLAISSFWYAWDSNMKTSMKNLGGWGLLFAMQGFEYIIMLSIVFTITETFLQCHFHCWFIKNCLLNVFTAGSKVCGCSGCWNRWWKWLSPLARDSNWWFHHRDVTFAGSDNLPTHDMNSCARKPIHMKNFNFYIWNEKKTNFLSKL